MLLGTRNYKFYLKYPKALYSENRLDMTHNSINRFPNNLRCKGVINIK